MSTVKKVAANIKNARLYRNYSQDYLAMKLNISQNAYSKIELGYTRVTMRRLFVIAEVLEIDVVELLNQKPDYRVAV
jgi:transcriptional regulator with XRE-family HTH domain